MTPMTGCIIFVCVYVLPPVYLCRQFILWMFD